jgi:hypothetical protein
MILKEITFKRPCCFFKTSIFKVLKRFKGKCTHFKGKEFKQMRNKSTAARLIKRKSEKCISGIVRSYSKLQDKFAQMLDEDESVLEYRVNVDIGNVPHFDYLYTTDFVVKKKVQTTL